MSEWTCPGCGQVRTDEDCGLVGHTCEEIDSLEERAERAEAQIQAMRKACDGYEPDGLRPGDWWAGYYTALDRIYELEVLDE